MDLILVRYAELGLKGRPVRRRFKGRLLDNMMSMLALEGIETLISTERGRIYVETDSIDGAIEVLTRVFGIASVSPVIQCGASIEEINAVSAEYSTRVLAPGDAFAIRSRREGTHNFSSMDVAREAGAAVLGANEGREISVELNDPDKEIFIEVRGGRAYIFSEYIPGPGGLPLGTQGKLVALIEKKEDLLAAWMMMKRGGQTLLVVEERVKEIDQISAWNPDLEVTSSSVEEAIEETDAGGAVFGYQICDMERIRGTQLDVPSFFPLVGMKQKEIKEGLEKIL